MGRLLSWAILQMRRFAPRPGVVVEQGVLAGCGIISSYFYHDSDFLVGICVITHQCCQWWQKLILNWFRYWDMFLNVSYVFSKFTRFIRIFTCVHSSPTKITIVWFITITNKLTTHFTSSCSKQSVSFSLMANKYYYYWFMFVLVFFASVNDYVKNKIK